MNIKSVELESGLYLVATPIGNLRDITYRAVDVLKQVDLVLCEDSRVSGKLMKAYGIDARLKVYNDHSEESLRKHIISELSAGKSIALISDAGTPLISDPGYKLVRDCLDLGLKVVPVPGANAPLSALQLSGLPSDKFTFIGFLPQKTAARQAALKPWAEVMSTLICFERGSRLLDALKDAQEVLGDREVAVIREMTKLYEESRRAKIGQLIEYYDQEGLPKGEIVVVFAPPTEKTYTAEDLKALLRASLEENRVKDAARIVADMTGQSRKDLYEMALALNAEKA